MEKLKGPDSIGVVSSRFSDGYDVVGCVQDFYKQSLESHPPARKNSSADCWKGMAEIESTYASSVIKLLKSVSYTFHSNVLMQWLGSDPFEELGTVMDGWQKLGAELEKLASHHTEKAKSYANLLRQPLSDLLPRLEGMRKTIRTRGKELVSELEHCRRKHHAEKQNYMRSGNRYQKMMLKIASQSSDTNDTKYSKQHDELRSLSDALKHQEALYQSSVHEFQSAQRNFDKELASLYKTAEVLELDRVNALSKSLQEFAKILSNTAPSYLECMQRIVFSVADIDATRDVDSFVNDYKHLMTEEQIVQFEPHQCRKHVYPTSYIASGAAGKEASTTEKYISPNDKNLSDSKVSSTSKPVELPTPVDDHFRNGNEDKSVAMNDTSDEHTVVATRGDKIKAFTKKLKFWGRTMDKSSTNGTASEAAADDDETASPSDETAPQSFNDEIEAILSAPKKTKKATKFSRKPSMEVSDKQDSSSHKDQSLTDKKQQQEQVVTETAVKQKTPPQVAIAASNDKHPLTRELEELANDSTIQSTILDSANVKLAAPPLKQKPTVAVKPKPLSKPQASHSDAMPMSAKPQAHITPIQKHPVTAEGMFQQLEGKVAENDYYRLLGSEESASAEEIAKRRRERSQELHPDHFMTNAALKAKAEKELILINQVYTDVLSKERSRELYDQLCKFRKFYKQILVEKGPRLQNAKERMSSLRDSLRKAKTPLALQEEVDLAVKLIQLCLDQNS